jgi:hypothetical protein
MNFTNKNYIDKSIQEILYELNQAGYRTWHSCSGLKSEHNKPTVGYIVLDVPDMDVHKFMDMIFLVVEAGWEFTPFHKNMFGLYIKKSPLDKRGSKSLTDEDIMTRWNLLVEILLEGKNESG